MLLAVAVAAVITIWHGERRTPSAPRQESTLQGLVEVEALPPGPFRLATFNIHRGKGTDDRVDLQRTAALLRGCDLIALNEVDGDFGGASQAETLGELLGMAWLFAPTERRWWHEHFGNGLLSRVALGPCQRLLLPGNQGRKYRNAILTSVTVGDRSVRVLATHLDRGLEREMQLKLIVDLFLSLREPAVLLGDLNTEPDDPTLRALLDTPGVTEAGAAIEELPDRRIDWIIVRGLRPLAAEYVTNDASDHPVLWAELEVETNGEHGDGRSPAGGSN